MKNRIIVTGGSGFIGSQLVNKLFELDHDILNIDLKGQNNFTKNISLNNYSEIREVMIEFKPDYIVHCAGGTAEKYKNSFIDEFDHQFNGTKNISKLAMESSCKKLIFLSSDHVYYGLNDGKIVDENTNLNFLINPDKINYRYFFGLSKALSESICLKNNNSVVLRLASIYGNGDCSNLIGEMLDQAKNYNKIEIWGDGNRKVQFTFLDDVINAIIAALEIPVGIYNISNNEKYSIKDVSTIISNIFNAKIHYDLEQKEGPQFPYVSNEKFLSQTKNFLFTKIDDGIKLML